MSKPGDDTAILDQWTNSYLSITVSEYGSINVSAHHTTDESSGHVAFSGGDLDKAAVRKFARRLLKLAKK